MKTDRNIAYNIIYYIVIAAIVVVFIYPFWWMVTNSLNNINEIFGIVNEKSLSESVIYTFLKDTIYRIFPYLREYLSK